MFGAQPLHQQMQVAFNFVKSGIGKITAGKDMYFQMFGKTGDVEAKSLPDHSFKAIALVCFSVSLRNSDAEFRAKSSPHAVVNDNRLPDKLTTISRDALVVPSGNDARSFRKI